MSPGLVDAVEAFKTAMLEGDSCLRGRVPDADAAQALVSNGCDQLEQALREHVAHAGPWQASVGRFVFRETIPYFILGHFNDRALAKPRGYAGDYATIEMLYQDAPHGDGRLGPLIDRWTRHLPAARAVKNRRALLAEAIRGVTARYSSSQPVAVTSLAAGPARELFDVLAAPDAPAVHATCIDIDAEALAYTSRLAQRLGVAGQFTFAQDNVVRLAQGRGRTTLAPQQLIYSLGLTDYLADALVVQMIDWAYESLQPGGTLIVGNVVPTNPTRAFMDHILEWPLIHRTADELRELFARSRFGAAPVALELEPAGVDLFATCRKA
jgi:hypothetical protein